jgi:hypothetical protein
MRAATILNKYRKRFARFLTSRAFIDHAALMELARRACVPKHVEKPSFRATPFPDTH